jgi:hypothetical protein
MPPPVQSPRAESRADEMSTRLTEERPGSPAALPAVGGKASHVRATHVTEERHESFPGRSERWGGVGGHIGAPHVN